MISEANSSQSLTARRRGGDARDSEGERKRREPTHSDAKVHAGQRESGASGIDASMRRRHVPPIRIRPAEKATKFSAIRPLYIA